MTPSAPFDRIAPRYDELWTSTPVGRAQRHQVWRAVDGLFRAGDRLLDIGCGTGEDAAHFAARGVRVHAIDPSPEMICEASRRGGFTAEIARVEKLPEGLYDGMLSNFGALNCVEDLPGAARRIAASVRPGGRAAICVIGRFCLWEMLYHPLRRLRGSAASSIGVRVHYRTVAGIRTAFAPAFECERWMGIGLFVPPSYVRLPRWLVRVCGAMDHVFARLPIFRAMADHRLVLLVRK